MEKYNLSKPLKNSKYSKSLGFPMRDGPGCGSEIEEIAESSGENWGKLRRRAYPWMSAENLKWLENVIVYGAPAKTNLKKNQTGRNYEYWRCGNR